MRVEEFSAPLEAVQVEDDQECADYLEQWDGATVEWDHGLCVSFNSPHYMVGREGEWFVRFQETGEVIGLWSDEDFAEEFDL